MLVEDFSLVRLSNQYQIKSFDCDDLDLNDFLFEDAKTALNQHIAVTYLLEKGEHTVAYFCVFNDKISIKDLKSENFNFIQKIFTETGFENLNSYPAVKIGRLGVNKTHQNAGIGKWILDYLKLWFIDSNRTGCRFITVDAYAQSLGFYEKMGFDFMTVKDEGKSTRQMYFDLLSI